MLGKEKEKDVEARQRIVSAEFQLKPADVKREKKERTATASGRKEKRKNKEGLPNLNNVLEFASIGGKECCGPTTMAQREREKKGELVNSSNVTSPVTGGPAKKKGKRIVRVGTIPISESQGKGKREQKAITKKFHFSIHNCLPRNGKKGKKGTKGALAPPPPKKKKKKKTTTQKRRGGD